MLTYLVTAAGHHVLKAGLDGQINRYTHDQSFTGGASYGDGRDLGAPAGTVYESGRFGSLSGTDAIVDRPRVQSTTQSTILGGFIQDSWSVLDKVTLNLGLRYDALTMQGQDGKTRISLKDQLSPRLGLVWDPTQQGRSKLFVNYGRYYEYIPLDIADRSLSTSQSFIQGVHECNPLEVGRKGCDANTRTDGQNLINGVTQAPNRKWGQGGSYPSYVDPSLKSPASDEIVAGAEYEVLPGARAGVTYTYRNLVRTVEDMSSNDAQTFFIGNPGEGIADAFPEARRQYHAITVLFTKSFSDLWLAQASYTWAQLRGNYEGLFQTQGFLAPQLDPNVNATFDLQTLLLNQTGALPADITHTIKVYLGQGVPDHSGVQRHRGRLLQRQLRSTHQCAGSASHLRPRTGLHPRAGERRAAPLGHLARREDRPQLPAGEGLGPHRRGRGLQPLQLPAAGRGGRELHPRLRRPDPGRQAGQRSDRVWRDLPQRVGGQLRPRQRLTPPASGRSQFAHRGSDPGRIAEPERSPLLTGCQPHLGQTDQLPAGPSVPLQPPGELLAMNTIPEVSAATLKRAPLLMVAAAASTVIMLAGCPSEAPADCQTLTTLPTPVAQDGYVLRFVRAGAASTGCETATPEEMSDVWVFNTVADSKVLAHSVSMPFPDVDTLPPNLIGSGTFTNRETDTDGFCYLSSLTTMSDSSSGTLLSYAARNMRWLGGAAYQGAEFESDVTVTVGSCSADYRVQALSPVVGCADDSDCDPFNEPFSSGIFSGFDQGCTAAPWTSAVTAYLASTDYPSTGVCFLNQAFPSLLPTAKR